MTGQDPNEHLGRLDDSEEAEEPSSTTDGAAAAGEYDPAQGSPGHPHPPGGDHSSSGEVAGRSEESTGGS